MRTTLQYCSINPANAYRADLVGFVVALIAFHLADRKKGVPLNYSYGFQRAPVIGAFFNGAFLAGLGFSIVLQAIERLIKPEEVAEPLLVLIVGAVGLGLNILSALVVHGELLCPDRWPIR